MLFFKWGEKAPGPDGFTGLFFQKQWDIVGEAVIDMTQTCFRTRHISKVFNHTNISLIPKVPLDELVSQYRPIGLCNFIYKILSKTLVNRLKTLMNNIISQNQSAFIPKRSIFDNILLANEAIFVVNHNDKVEGIVAIKLDMSKAYDKLEWSFLESVLTRMSLSNHWIKLINQCVSIVSYYVLLNSIPTGFFQPEREALSSYIDSLLKKEILEGIKVCKDAPETTHLLFADDSLLFSKATVQNFQIIKDYLQKYCLASGQELNFDKSGILFSRRIPEHMKSQLVNILEINNRYLGEKYLSTPIMFQSSKIQTHMGILQAVDARISIWLHKLLSQASRTTFIKHIGQAIPLFQTGAFLNPKHLCKQIDSHLCKFWWGETLDPKDKETASARVGHYVFPQGRRLSGIRKVDLNKLAMLDRNAWRILENPNCMLAIVLKAKYFPRTDFLNAKCTNKCSWTWKCLHSIKEIIKPFISWIVGDGHFIDPWYDKWIPTLGTAVPNPLVPPGPNIKVYYFIDHSTRTWNMSRLNTHFDNAYVKKIITIPLSQLCTPDRRAWELSKNGKFSSKSSYMGLRGLSPSPFKNLWMRIWKIRVLYRIQVFTWKAARNALPARTFLRTKMPMHKVDCASCNDPQESIMHALVLCPFASRVWFLSDFCINTQFFQNKSFIAWKPCFIVSPITPVNLCDKWIPPSFGWIKCNTDGAYDDITRANGAGYVMRDFSIKASFCACLVFEVKSAEEAEARAIWAILKKALEQKLTHIIVESDVKTLIDQFSSGLFDGDSRTNAILKDIQFFSSKLVACIFNFQLRVCNYVAHELAQWEKTNNASIYWSVELHIGRAGRVLANTNYQPNYNGFLFS
ncbi:uncharacterized protein LOC113312346 [Papaver somniferum]|uniref:uncharacterized protein LOC113312346 n=1 Tax=Papaver somniferum TaxID=3469 RepID=UPI000E6FC3E9|nr:uncharacterized protein LOC113312346 [Papaver somniferum]